ncbi:PIN domain-containing protein [Capsulimonas corticalis]|uniref:PIN domain-containing protein n=1 Tax=Capsulimonas corticalis TaxID=2219043 RepID=A0A402CRL6_9BACT|nr:PIN domain-containing protein [Capsulimonas corticalis]BDI28155.1 PIN domain-containing protein [Capsulimonas corticalis]
MSKQKVILDACVLYPAGLRSVLMYLALGELYQAYWTDAIHDEWIRNVLEDRSDISPEQLARTRRLMDEAIPGSLVVGYESLIEDLDLPDRDDRHVLAATIHIEAQTIVTFNRRDFPTEKLAPYHIRTLTPDAFVLDLVQTFPLEALEALKIDRLSKQRPPKSPEEYLAALTAQSLTQSTAALRQYIEYL